MATPTTYRAGSPPPEPGIREAFTAPERVILLMAVRMLDGRMTHAPRAPKADAHMAVRRVLARLEASADR